MLLPELPSPKVQLNVYGAVPPDAEAVNVTACPTDGDAGEDVKSTASASGVTVTDRIDEALLAAESVAVTVTVYVPLTAYAWSTDLPEPVIPSPKVQLYAYGGVPPVAVAVKLTIWPTAGEAGVKVKVTASPGGWTVMV